METYPIRLIVGVGTEVCQGLGIVYEKPDGSAGQSNIWFDYDDFKKVRFSDEESYIVFTGEKSTEIPKQKRGFWDELFGAEYEEPQPVVKEVVINRCFCLPR